MGSIAQHSIFGDYNTKENRVTAAILHILELGRNKLLEYLLADSGFILPDDSMVISTQQKTGGSVPDGYISANYSFNIWVEVKIKPNSVNTKQLNTHLLNIKGPCDRVLYITPDNQIPNALNGKTDVIWMSFQTIIDKLEHYPTDNEILKFLIEQLRILFDNYDLLDDYKNRVLIVGGSWGENIAIKHKAYICQNRRYFKRSQYLAFAYRNKIRNLFKIISEEDDVDLRTKPSLVNSDYFKVDEPGYKGDLRKYMVLSDPIHTFKPEIVNDNKDKNGNPCAYVQSQRYTTFDKIKKAKKTSEL